MDIALADPLTLPCGVVLPNRLVKAAMSEQLATREQEPSDRLLRLYSRWAVGGCGLLITGNVMIARDGISEPGQVVIDSHSDPDRLRQWSAAARSGGARAIVQLNHGGRQVPRWLNRHPVAPSPISVPGFGRLFGRPREMTRSEINTLVESFAYAARASVAAGFDGVQVHAAHGYLLSQFLSPAANRRSDEYGGSVQARSRPLLQVVAAVREAVGPDHIVAVKLNSADFQRGGFDEQDAAQVSRDLDAAGIDLLEISGGTLDRAAMVGVSARRRGREAYFLDFAARLRDQVAIPLMVTGGFRSASGMHRALAEGTTDLIGLARPLVHEPDLPARLMHGSAAGSLIDSEPSSSRALPRRLVGLDDILWHTTALWRLGDLGEPRQPPSRVVSMASYLSTYLGAVLARLLPTRSRPAGSSASPASLDDLD